MVLDGEVWYSPTAYGRLIVADDLHVDVPDPMNAAAIFVDRHVDRGRADKVAILCEDRQLTYGQVFEQVNQLGNALRELGVAIEERVALLLLDGPEFVVSFFGAIKIGAVPIPINTLFTSRDCEYILNDSRARVLIVNDALMAQIEPIRARLKYLRHVVVAGKDAAGNQTFQELVGAASPHLAPEPMSKDDVCFWLYSSGTTGFPKGAVHLQHDMIFAAELYSRRVVGIREEDRTFSIAKLFFAYGLGNGLYFPFYVGASTVYYPGKPDPIRFFETIARHRPTLFFAVPTGYAAMLAVPEAERRYDTSSIRLCVSAGEALPPALWHNWKERFGTEILDGIGSTEILHIFISNRPGRCKPGSTGEVVPGYEARIVDEHGNEVGEDTTGDLLIKGDSICSCYWNQHEKSKQIINGEWIRTGDKYQRDRDGYFWYQGRTDDMLKVCGMWVSPVEVENALMAHEAVLECGVAGIEDTDRLIKPKAFVVLKRDRRESPELAHELQQFVRAKLAPYKYPRWVQFVPDLPKTATGKIQRYRLRQMG
ncbi:MAG: benzoate-CoA ligase family protein [Planctomycetota bacterium]